MATSEVRRGEKHYSELRSTDDILEKEIQKREHIEKELKISEHKYKSLIEGSVVGITAIDRLGRFTLVNKAFCNMIGYSEKELMSKNFIKLVHPMNRPGLIKIFLLGVRHPGHHQYIETRLVRKNGDIIYIEAYPNALTVDNKVVGVTAIINDVTEKKKLEEKLNKTEFQLKLQEKELEEKMILDSVEEGIFTIDVDGNCTMCNKSCLEKLGYKDQKEILGKNMHKLMHYKKADGSQYPISECTIIRAVKDLKNSHSDSEVFWRKDGKSFPAEFWSYTIYGKDGKLRGAVVTFLDITEHKKDEENIIKYENQMKRNLEELERFRQISVGRELKMIELKKRIAQLEDKAKRSDGE